MIITAQPFFNELDMLEIKCRELAGIVDAHVILEATHTYTGLPKPLHFAENRARFAQWPILHYVSNLHEADEIAEPWDREFLQRRELLEIVRQINPELVIWCDADEIPRRDTVSRFRERGLRVMTLDMDQLIFFFDRLDTRYRCTEAKIGRWDPSCTMQPWRGETFWPVLEDAGWHFEFFGDRETLMAKLWATSHATEEGGAMMRAEIERGDLPGLEKAVPYPAWKLPAFVRENRTRFEASFCDKVQP